MAQVGKAMSSNESAAYEIMRMLDVDYVLVIFGGVIGYSGDDINKFLWMVRIAEGEHPKDIRVSGTSVFSHTIQRKDSLVFWRCRNEHRIKCKHNWVFWCREHSKQLLVPRLQPTLSPPPPTLPLPTPQTHSCVRTHIFRLSLPLSLTLSLSLSLWLCPSLSLLFTLSLSLSHRSILVCCWNSCNCWNSILRWRTNVQGKKNSFIFVIGKGEGGGDQMNKTLKHWLSVWSLLTRFCQTSYDDRCSTWHSFKVTLAWSIPNLCYHRYCKRHNCKEIL